MLERDEYSLTRILDGLDQLDHNNTDIGGDVIDLRDLADPGQEDT